MASLSETQLPILERDKQNGLIPAQDPQESRPAYYQRLARKYYLPIDEVVVMLDG